MALACALVACSDGDGPASMPLPAPIPLAQISLETGLAGSNVVEEEIRIAVRIGQVDGDELALVTLFDRLVRSEDEGRTVTVDASNSEEFEAAIAVLTNGIDDVIEWFRQLPGRGSALTRRRESSLIMGGLDGSWDPDFQGAVLTHVVLHLDRVLIETPGRDPNGDGTWTDWSVSIRLVIFGRP